MPKPCCQRKCDDVMCDKFLGTFPTREQQLLDDATNTRVYNIDLSYSSTARFKVVHDNPNAVMQLYVYNKNSYFTGQLGVGQPSLSQQLETTFYSDLSGGNPLEVAIEKDFLPGRYTIRIVLVSSPSPVNFKLYIKANKLYNCRIVVPQDHVLCGFWQSESKGYLTHYLITKRCDGKLYVEVYYGDISSGFQKASYYYYINQPTHFVLEQFSENVYRYQPDPLYDTFNYFSLDQTNANGLLFVSGGGANHVFTEQNYYTRLQNWETYVVDFNNGKNYQSPVEQFNIYTNQLLTAQNVQVNKFTQASDYPGLGPMLNTRDKILSTGIIETYEGQNIWPEQVYFVPGNAVVLTNPIKTYAPKTLNNISVLITTPNTVAYYDPANTYEIGMTLKLSGVFEASNIGIANEWINIYYLYVGSQGGYNFLTPIRLGVSYPITAEIIVAYLTVTPYSIKLTHNLNFRLLSEYNDRDARLVTLSGFSAVGGLSTDVLNRRYAVAYSSSVNFCFLTLPPGNSYENDPVATSNAIGGGNGLFNIASYPASARTINMYNYNSNHLNADPITIFFTTEPALANPNTQVEISGLIDEYEKLNGIHDVHWFANCSNMKDNKNVWKKGFDSIERKYFTPVAVDSSGLPSFNAQKHTLNGFSYTLKHIVNPVKEDSGYGDFAGALCFMMNKLGVSTHGYVRLYADYIRGIRNPSWNSIQELVGMNVSSLGQSLSRGFDIQAVGNYNGVTALTNRSYLTELNKDAYVIPGQSINQAARYDPSTLAYRALADQASKYLEPQTYNVYAKISGQVLNDRVPGSDPLHQNISNKLVSLGANANGTILDYEIHPSGEIIEFGISLVTPFAKRFLLFNAFASDGFVPEQFDGDVILANPITAAGPLQADCAGKIVIIRRGGVTFGAKLLAAFNVGAKAVIIFNNAPGPLTNSTTGGYNPGIPCYTMSGVDGNALTGYNGGIPTDPSSYAMPTTVPTGYTAVVGYDAIVANRRLLVGTPSFILGKVRKEFSNGKNIGYIYYPDSALETSLGLEELYEFRYIYGVTDFIAQRAKMFNVIMQAVVGGVKLADMDAIIMNNSGNVGGPTATWASYGAFFGDDRDFLGLRYCLADNGLSPTIIKQDYDQKYPSDYPLMNQVDDIQHIQAKKYQALYPDAAFKGKKIVHLTSTVAFSAGDTYNHAWKNHRGDYTHIGNGVESITVGIVDGRLHGASGVILSYSPITKTSAFYVAPSINGQYVPATSYSLSGEGAYLRYDPYSGKSVSNQLDYIKINGINNSGPINSWVEGSGGFYQATGFSTPYLRDTPQYQIFNNVIGLPKAGNVATIHYPWLEDAILAANN